MTFMYIAEPLGWIIDPTLDEGLLGAFMILSIAASVVYFPTLIFVNKLFWTKLQMEKLNFFTLISIFFILGFASFCGIAFFV